MRASGILKNIDLKEMMDTFTNGGLEERRKVNTDILEHEMVHVVPGKPEMYISYSNFSTPMGGA